jgi:hypothetical protein
MSVILVDMRQTSSNVEATDQCNDRSQVPSLEPISITVTALRRGWHYAEARAIAPGAGRGRGAASPPLAATDVAAFRVLHLQAQPDSDAIDLGYRGSVLLIDASESDAVSAGGRGSKDGIVAMCRRSIWTELPGGNDSDENGPSAQAAEMTVEEEEFAVQVVGFAGAYEAAVQVCPYRV